MAQLKVFAVLAMVWLAAASAFAHHPFADEFDRSQTVTLNGTVTRIEWQNPHVYTYVDVKDPQGKVVNWKVEMGSPEALMKEGWTRTSVKPGDQVTIQAWKAKNNPTLANADSFMLPDGKKMAAASSAFVSERQLAQGGEPQSAQESQFAREPAVGTSGAQSNTTTGRQSDTTGRESDTRAAAPADALPSTASPLALYGLLGALTLGGALGLRRIRR